VAEKKPAVPPEFVDVELSRPLKIDGADVKAMRMREPLLGDQYAASKAGNDDPADTEMWLIANLCSVTVEDLKRLTMRDYVKLQKALLSFRG
jgi:hypothetical protein